MLLTQIYPTALRSTGLGWAGGAGRIGGIIAPLVGGLALASSFTLEVTLAMIAVPPVVVALLVLLLKPIRRDGAPAAKPVVA
jgi:AAHS family 4-hydroxybenzoate transporter-like MFS transporter